MTLRFRRKVIKSTSNGRAMEMKTDGNQEPVYEQACEVTAEVHSLDKNGRLVSTKQAANTPTENGKDLMNNYEEAVRFSGYSTVTPVQVSQSPVHDQADKKRAARTAQHGADNTAPGSGGSGEVGKGSDGMAEEDRIICDSVNDVTLVDNAIYANATTPASSPLATSSSTPAAAEAEQTTEPICTSINDFTLIDNAIYNN